MLVELREKYKNVIVTRIRENGVNSVEFVVEQAMNEMFDEMGYLLTTGVKLGGRNAGHHN